MGDIIVKGAQKQFKIGDRVRIRVNHGQCNGKLGTIVSSFGGRSPKLLHVRLDLPVGGISEKWCSDFEIRRIRLRSTAGKLLAS